MRALGAAWHAVSKQEGRNCVVGQKDNGILWIDSWPKALSICRACLADVLCKLSSTFSEKETS
jgi:hypothetical protein